MKRVQLRSKDVQEHLTPYGIEISKKDNLELLEDESILLVLLNKEISFFFHGKCLIPALPYFVKNPTLQPLKKVTVDMGAIKFIIGGADIMRPGITTFDPNISQGEYVLIIDQTHGKPIAVGKALVSSPEIQTQTKGKVVENIHYIGDKIWTFKLVK